MFGFPLSLVFTVLKVAAVAFVVGALVHKGMMIERARWERALVKKNADIAEVNAKAEAQIEAARLDRDSAFEAANNAALAMIRAQTGCVLPDELVTKANKIR